MNIRDYFLLLVATQAPNQREEEGLDRGKRIGPMSRVALSQGHRTCQVCIFLESSCVEYSILDTIN